ncbi:MAG: hypothetical protein WD847_04455 [Pirellulales bacterium]
MPHVDTPQSRCLCGVARCDITPPVGIYHRMWGAATHDRSTGVHRPLTATALVLRNPAPAPVSDSSSSTDPTDELALIAVDHCLLWSREMAALRSAVAEGAGLTPEQVLVLFSHTHAAGLMGLERRDLPGGELIEAYLGELGRKLAAIVGEARAALQPVTITYGEGRCDLAAHRDFWDADNGRWVCGYNPQGPADDTLLVGRITGHAGSTLATLVNYACHPTTLAWQNTLISPDYPGAMREVIESATSAPAIFVQGASGDLGPKYGYVGDTAVADANGRKLGYAALAALESLPPPGTRFEYGGPVISGAVIGTWEHVPLDTEALRPKEAWQFRRSCIDLALRPGLPSIDELRQQRERLLAEEQQARTAGDAAHARDYRAQAEVKTRQLVRLGNLPPGPAFSFPIQLLKLGDAVWLAIEAEHYQLLQTALRSRFPGTPLVVATLVNGSLPTYLPTRETYGTGIYQETVALLAPGSLEHLIEAIGGQISELLARPVPLRARS